MDFFCWLTLLLLLKTRKLSPYGSRDKAEQLLGLFLISFDFTKNSWKFWGFVIFNCRQLWFHEKKCQKFRRDNSWRSLSFAFFSSCLLTTLISQENLLDFLRGKTTLISREKLSNNLNSAFSSYFTTLLQTVHFCKFLGVQKRRNVDALGVAIGKKSRVNWPEKSTKFPWFMTPSNIYFLATV